MYLLSKFWRLLFGWLAPVLIFVMVLSWYGLDSQTINQSFESRNFYVELDSELDTAINSIDSQTPKTFSTLLGIAVIQQTATPEWIEEVIENNVTLTTQWVTGESEEWTVYVPAADLENAVSENINDSTNKVISADSTIAACSTEEEQSLLSNGFSLDTELCLPQSVIEGRESFSEFFALDDTVVASNTLNSLVDNANLSSLSDQLPGRNLAQNNTVANQIGSVGINVRSVVIFIRSYSFVFVSLIILLICADLIFAIVINKKIIHELRKIFIHLGSTLLLLAISWIMMFGGSAWLSSALWGSLFSGFYTNSLQNLIVSQLAWTSASMILPVIMLGSLLIVIGLVLMLLNRFHIFGTSTKNNQKIANYQPKGENETFDGKFKKLLSQKIGISTPTKTPNSFDNTSNSFQNSDSIGILPAQEMVPTGQGDQFDNTSVVDNSFDSQRSREIEAARQRLQEQLLFEPLPELSDTETQPFVQALDFDNPFDRSNLNRTELDDRFTQVQNLNNKNNNSDFTGSQVFETQSDIIAEPVLPALPDQSMVSTQTDDMLAQYLDDTYISPNIISSPKPLVSSNSNSSSPRKLHF